MIQYLMRHKWLYWFILFAFGALCIGLACSIAIQQYNVHQREKLIQEEIDEIRKNTR